MRTQAGEDVWQRAGCCGSAEEREGRGVTISSLDGGWKSKICCCKRVWEVEGDFPRCGSVLAVGAQRKREK